MAGPIVLEGSGMRVVFARLGDRYQHSLSIVAEGKAAEVCHSVEGGQATDWPDSPPVQQIHHEQRESRQLVLGTGMSGASYWSLSCELDPDRDRLVFDVACRVQGTPDQLGSLYRLATGCQRDAGQQLVTCLGACAWTCDGCLRIEHERIECLPRVSAAGLATVRWSYVISRLDSPA